MATESQGIETGRAYAHIFRYVSCGIGHNKTNRRTIQIEDGQLDAINPPYHLPNTRLRAISAPRNGEFPQRFFGCHCSDSAGSASARSYACFLGGHESSPATAAYTASRHRGKRHGHAQRLRRHRADVQDTEHAARGACLAREVEQAVAVVLVLLIPCLDLGGEAVGQRCREGVEAVEDIDDLPLGGDEWGGNLDSR